MNTGYAELMKTKHVPFLVASSVMARMPLGSSVMLMVLLVDTHYGAAAAGTATALMTGAMAVCAPLLGKLIDMGKAPISMVVLGVIQAACIIGIVFATQCQSDLTVVLALALCAGVASPPVAGTTRSLWSSTVRDELVSTAYDLEVLIVDVLYVAGPLAASALLAWMNTGSALGLMYACMAIGCIMLASSMPVRAYARNVGGLKGNARAHRNDSRLLSNPNVVLLLMACAFTSAFSGWIETAVPLYYSRTGSASLSGTAISIWSIGSIAGIVLFTHLHPKRMPAESQLALFTGLYGIVCLGLAFPLNGTVLMAVLFLVGVAVSPGTSLQYQVAGRLTPEGRQGEMFSWVNTAVGVGLALGSYCAGLLADHLGTGLLFLTPVGFVIAAAVCAWTLSVKVGSMTVEERGTCRWLRGKRL